MGSMLLCGKDSFVKLFNTVYGHNPKIDPASNQAT